MRDDALERLRARVAAVDPLLILARADVDDTLLDWALALSPLERLRASSRATRALARFRRCTAEDCG